MKPKRRTGFRWRRLLVVVGALALLLLSIVAGRCLYAFRDRHPGYEIALDISAAPAASAPRSLRVGFARMRINPDLSNPAQPIWLAGFSQHRAATGIHDDLWAVACVLEDGPTRLGVVALDAIGFFHDDVITVRRRLASNLELDYTVICATHNHSTPDLLGLWGPDYLHTGVNAGYREQVIAAAAETLGHAVTNLRPARVAFIEIPTPTAGLVADTRKPEVFDPDLRVMHFTEPVTGTTLGTIVGWANHPETVWSRNTEITSDYCGSLRDTLENGVADNGKLLASGVGGIHLFVNGAIGGLMSTTPGVTVRDPYLQRDFQEPTFDKARALGRQLASRILPRLAETNALGTEHAPIGIRARTIEVPLENRGYLLAPVLGLIDRGHVRWKRIRTEVALITIGDAGVVCVPGEIYPELVNGGVVRAPGADFDIAPVEVPPLRELMPGRVKFVFGLANDEIGYLIPKSEWDDEPPYLYGAERGVYGEINSCGPEAAAAVHSALKELCRGGNLRGRAPSED